MASIRAVSFDLESVFAGDGAPVAGLGELAGSLADSGVHILFFTANPEEPSSPHLETLSELIPGFSPSDIQRGGKGAACRPDLMKKQGLKRGELLLVSSRQAIAGKY